MGIIHVSAVFPLLVLIATFESVQSLTITAYHQCLDLGALNPSDVSTLNTIGLQQCMRECLGDRTCLSLNYWRNDLRCTQHRVKTGGAYGLVPDSECIYWKAGLTNGKLSIFNLFQGSISSERPKLKKNICIGYNFLFALVDILSYSNYIFYF